MFCADPQAVSPVPEVPEGFDGRLSLRSVEMLGFAETVGALERFGVLICWAQAQQARVAARLEELFARDIARAAGREDPSLALSLAAAEAGAVLNLPHMTAMRLVSESSRLNREHPQTLARLAEGRIGYQHARIILDETQHLPDVPAQDLAGTEPGSGLGAGTGTGSGSGTGTDGHSQHAPAAAESGNHGDKQPTLLDRNLLSPEPEDAGVRTDASQTGVKTDASQTGVKTDASQTGVRTDASQTGVNPQRLGVRQRFEADLLSSAEGRTAAGFGKKARRLRESRFPQTVTVRHRDAVEKRRVCFEALPDGMSCLTAFLAAEQGQAIYTALSGAARAGKTAGDPRTMDQLRADTLAAVLLDGEPREGTPPPAPSPAPLPSPRSPAPLPPPRSPRRTKGARPASPDTRVPWAGSESWESRPWESRPWKYGEPHAAANTGNPDKGSSFSDPNQDTGAPRKTRSNSKFGKLRDVGIPGGGLSSYDGPARVAEGPGTEGIRETGEPEERSTSRSRPVPGQPAQPSLAGQGATRAERPRSRRRPASRSRVRTEVMVLINADTLAGLDQAPAELNGYGPISAETGRTMILQALSWTPLLQDPDSGEILAVGRRRRIPAGLKRWLQARDGTCRFPGCAVNVTRSEIDHTTPWARGGPTEHSNLEHLCPKHHRFKTLGYWKARQPEAGALDWTSPTGRTYSTQPALELGGPAAGLPLTPNGPLSDPPPRQTSALWADNQTRTEEPNDPPPF